MKDKDIQLDIVKASSRPWMLWRTYLIRWLTFGFIAGAIGRPITDNIDHYWQQVAMQGLSGLVFGLACWVVFTPLQNIVNPSRKRWLSWVTVIGTWIGMKFVFAGILGRVLNFV
ncbi:hypothetical protein [Chromobacterium sp. ATCC 53434]|uniref:hypothetical protein n=1 Tax=Chromobacterium sp. (strain ATCC 53434 / SC 14030) TaxID=2059672 RepID=UPI00130528C8|nr:hypothetical protein [Chromobacterium sp. ATCC 53434]